MSNSTPEIPGYQLDQRVLQHPLAELWHGRTFTGMEVIALVLSDAGARDATVLERLVRASRDAALVPGQHETPLWAANFNSDRPYAITQLIPGESGAERLIDPLDGILGNDNESLQAVRAQLSQYGAIAPSLPETERPAMPSYADQQTGLRPDQQTEPQRDQPQAAPQPDQSKVEVARQKIGAWAYLVAALIVLLVFTITYSVGAAIGSSVKSDEPVEGAPPAAVSPEAFPTPVLLPAIEKITTAPYKRPDGSAGVFGATYAAGADLQVITNAELPFALGWPRPPQVIFLGESSTIVYRRVVTRSEYSNGGMTNSIEARIALHPCASQAGCLTDRAAFDKEWTTTYKVPAPAAAKDARTWLTVQTRTPYAETMTRAFQSGGQWWLVGVAVTAPPDEEPDAQRIINDIWRQTS